MFLSASILVARHRFQPEFRCCLDLTGRDWRERFGAHSGCAARRRQSGFDWGVSVGRAIPRGAVRVEDLARRLRSDPPMMTASAARHSRLRSGPAAAASSLSQREQITSLSSGPPAAVSARNRWPCPRRVVLTLDGGPPVRHWDPHPRSDDQVCTVSSAIHGGRLFAPR